MPSAPGSARADAPLRRLLIVNTTDAGGGAERVATTLLDGFPALGTETWLAVGDQRTAHPRVVSFHSSPHVDYRPHAKTAERLALATGRWIDRRLGLEDFHHPYARYVLELTGSRPDLVLCNNLHGGYFDLRILPWLSRQVPVVLRLADSWTFTGHCACPLGCSRWEHGCGACPDLERPPAVERDATALNWRRKRRIFADARLFVVTPSRWLMERARRSLLAPAVQAWQVVPNGVDLGIFRPGARGEARRRLGLDPERRLLVFVSNLGAANPNKDYPTLRAAMERLGRGVTTPLELLVVGREAPAERLGERVGIRHLPYCDSRERLADFYRAADAYVHAAREESFCLAATEALACGTPVVAAAGGGVAEVVNHETTGLLVPPGDAAALAAAGQRLLDDPRRREAMGAAAARTARARFDGQRMVAEMHAWCVEAAARWRRLPGTAAGSAGGPEGSEASGPGSPPWWRRAPLRSGR